MNLLIRNAEILTCDGNGTAWKRGCMAVQGEKITYVGPDEPAGAFDRVIDGTDRILMPGLINCHTHVAMTGMRGFADDLALQSWLDDWILPTEDRMNGKCAAVCAGLGMAEMLATGTTSFSDTYFFCDEIAEVVRDSGMKANLSRSLVHFDETAQYDRTCDTRLAEAIALYDRWHNFDHGRIRVDVGVHAEYTSTSVCRRAAAALADEKGIAAHFHLAETKREQQRCVDYHGKTPTRLFYEDGLLTDRALAAHGVWLTEEDLSLFAETGACIVHCPVSNLKLASGIAPVTRMTELGIRVALGTDSVASNNSHDLFEELKLAAILQKGTTLQPEILPAGTVLRMATANGARAQLREDCGVLAAGMDADFILLDVSRPGLYPHHDTASAAVYSARGSDVCMTAVRGRILYENGEFTTLDVEKLRAEMEHTVRPAMFPEA